MPPSPSVPSAAHIINSAFPQSSSGRLTKIVGHHELIGKRLFGADSNHGLSVAQNLETFDLAVLYPPFPLFLDDVEKRNDIAETTEYLLEEWKERLKVQSELTFGRRCFHR